MKKKEVLTIVKIGGKVLDNDEALAQVLADFAQVNPPKILVHGGGKRATQLCQQLGVESQMINGRRRTNTETLEVVTMVYAGLINKKVVALLQALNCNALGFSGADADMIQATKRPATPVDYGFAGDIESVNTASLDSFLTKGITPVFCAITHDGKGQLLNTNADTIAATLAASIANHYEVVLKFCFEKKGVLLNPDDDDVVIPTLNQKDYEFYQQKGIISEGMLPKLDNAFSAKQAKVQEVRICGLEGILEAKGTEIWI